MTAINTATYGAITASNRFNQAAAQTVRDASSDSGDLVSDFVEQKEARLAFEANISVIKTADAMTGRLLNLKA